MDFIIATSGEATVFKTDVSTFDFFALGTLVGRTRFAFFLNYRCHIMLPSASSHEDSKLHAQLLLGVPVRSIGAVTPLILHVDLAARTRLTLACLQVYPSPTVFLFQIALTGRQQQ